MKQEHEKSLAKSREKRLPNHARAKLREYFDRYDLDASGQIDNAIELTLLVTNIRYLCCNQYGINVPASDVHALQEACHAKIAHSFGSGLGFDAFLELAVPCFQLYSLFETGVEANGVTAVKVLNAREIEEGFEQYRLREVLQCTVNPNPIYSALVLTVC